MAFKFHANSFFILKNSLYVWSRRRLVEASCSSSVEVGGAVPEHEGHDVLEELPFLFVSPRPQDLDFVASEEPLIVLGRSDGHMLSLFWELTRIVVLRHFENWLHQDDGAQDRQAFFHLRKQLLDLFLRKVTEAEDADDAVVSV